MHMKAGAVWIEVDQNFPCLKSRVPGAWTILALGREITLEKGVVQIDIIPTGSKRPALPRHAANFLS